MVISSWFEIPLVTEVPQANFDDMAFEAILSGMPVKRLFILENKVYLHMSLFQRMQYQPYPSIPLTTVTYFFLLLSLLFIIIWGDMPTLFVVRRETEEFE